MSRTSLVGFAIAIALAAPPARAEPLYQSFDYGAAEQVVLADYPGAKLDEANSAGVLRAYRLEDHPATGMWTYFTFMRGGLAEVKFHGRGAAEYLRIVEGLKSRYGAPDSESTASDSGVAIWRRGTTTIRAQLDHSYGTVVGPVTEPFTVTYEHSANDLTDAL